MILIMKNKIYLIIMIRRLINMEELKSRSTKIKLMDIQNKIVKKLSLI